MSKYSALTLTALLFYAVLTIWVPERWAWVLFQEFLFLLAAIWAIRIIINPTRSVGSILLLPLTGLLAWGMYQVRSGITIYSWATYHSLLDWLTYLVIFTLALHIFVRRHLRIQFLSALFYFGFGLSVLATVQMFTSGGKIFWLFPSGYTDFVLGPFVYRNQYAAFMELILPLGLAAVVRYERRAMAHAWMAGAMLASVAASGSRAGVILAALEIIALAVLAYRRGLVSWRILGLAGARLVVMAGLFTAVVGWETLGRRFEQADAYATRGQMLRSSLEMIGERPWTGFGLGTWAVAYPAYARFDDGSFVNQAHNDWAQWAVEGGLPLFTLLLLMALAAVRPALRSLWGVGILFVWLHALVDYPMQQRPALTACLFALLGALAAEKHGGAWIITRNSA